MTSMPFLTPFRLFGSTRLVGLVFVIWGMVASIQSIPMRAEEGVDSNASGSGPKTNIDDEPGLLIIEGTVVDENGDPVPNAHRPSPMVLERRVSLPDRSAASLIGTMCATARIR